MTRPIFARGTGALRGFTGPTGPGGPGADITAAEIADARDAAQQAADAAEAAAAAAAAVGATSDAQQANNIENGPLTKAKLSASFVGKAMKQTADATAVVLWTIEPAAASAGRAKFGQFSGNATFAGVKDPLLFWGYNAAYSVAPSEAKANEPVIRFGIEGLYRAVNWAGTGITEDTMEAYLELFNSDRSINDFRPWAVTAGRETRWATTQIEIGTDASTAKSQFFVKGKPITLGANTTDNILRVDNDRIASNLQHSHNGAPINLVTFPSGKNAHLFFIQDDGAGNQTTPWYLANFGGDLNHYLWDQAHGRMHSEYVGGTNDGTARSVFHSRVEALGGLQWPRNDGPTRPIAANTVPAATAFYDGNLAKVIVSDGSIWRDANGATA